MQDTTKQQFEGIETLYQWSFNFDRESNPFHLFLDLIGYSKENWGENWLKETPELGYLEMHYLANALEEYSNHNYTVTYAFIEDLLMKEID
jgi:hypothetical protein